MKIVADENMPLVDLFFSQYGEVVTKPGRLLKRADVEDADILLVRSVTKVNAALLENTPIKFVGSATIGVDHIDTEYLAKQGIGFSAAPGCNAQAVVEYVFVALLELEKTRGYVLEEMTVGIMGLGNVGSRLKAALEKLGITVLACDPPLKAQGVAGLVDYEEILKADVITFHTPLTLEGSHPTYHLVDTEFLGAMKPDALLINASRGSVIDNRALNLMLEGRQDLSVVLDVWEGEPLIDRELAQRVEVATPHIAGYSFDGKVRGTSMIYEAFCKAEGIDASIQTRDLIPPEVNQVIDLMEGEVPMTARALTRLVYNIMEDDFTLRSTLKLPRERRVAAFDQLRKHYKLRREFAEVTLRGFDQWVELVPAHESARIRSLGFMLE